MTVPEIAHGEYRFWERMENARQACRIVSGRLVKFFVQPTRADCVHACTVDDLARMLSYLSAGDWAGVGAVLLRQPRRKEQTLEAVWGRFSYAADLVDGHGNVLYHGPAIVIEAVNPGTSIKLGKRLFPEDLAELERLKTDGHIIRSGDRGHTIESTLESCRATQLYRTFPHEVGHWVDFLKKVELPHMDASSDYATLLERFYSRPSKEKEQFAHGYAEQLRLHLTASQAIPFDRQLDRERIQHDSLLLQDFELS